MNINLVFFIAVLAVSIFSHPVLAKGESLLLTGKISSAKKQVVTAPRGRSWNIQIQWLEEEGKMVEAGDLIAVFDGSLIQSQLEANEETLETEQLELTQITMDLEQEYLEAQGALTIAQMRVEQAKIEANVPESQVSQLDKGKFELTLQRTQMELIKAEENLKLAEQALLTGIEKQRIQIRLIEDEIRYQRSQMEKMSVTANFKGPISYAIHPWSGEKMAAGINVRAAWNIIDVQATDNFQIESWVHEIDVERLKANKNVELVLDAYPSKKFKGKLTFLSTQTEKKVQWSNSVYYPVIFQFVDTPELTLLPGMSVRVDVPPLTRGDN
ncbi:HlyD family efflux transporter periplasmic adaptor subunit [Aliiglaciecola sp. 2_MG-2023]|uniref:HlyD family secretion protein n=1 Tax=unclassified Aliiglaciecola TaxID=2593648 RepID=UPI0026E1EA92|nr:MULTISPECIES: HlyD family efflux transporter periplasmic adaptor subunit [unclassified Aliiglaciecola]MDO6713349.1 HlyD family efflux transporter periplasmic adaptor subunit [Aliiglaciecola sp. 2_MG-2023]MDO6754474.1 HlyD family efflux transporter periplasmic adaptor subunit [Aliiglaciecola sp. 1_MG-2023]